MGQAKYNPKHQQAKAGEIEPKPPRLGKAATKRATMRKIEELTYAKDVLKALK